MDVIVEIKETDGDNDDNGQDEESDVVKSGVLVEQMVIMVLLNEEVVVPFHDQVLVMNNLCLLDPPEQLVIHLGPLVDQFQFCLVAINHLAVQFSLHQKSYYEPVNPNKSIHMAFSEQQHDSHDYCERSFNNHVKVFEHVKNQFQVHIFQMHDLRFVHPVSARSFKCQRLSYQLLT